MCIKGNLDADKFLIINVKNPLKTIGCHFIYLLFIEYCRQ